MTKRKNLTRNALFTSILSLLLCVSMLVGTTFAWFTDSVVSGTNTIAAGNLDVELYHSDKNDSGYVGETTVLFNDVTLWEPGAVVYENFKVENVGNLALMYNLSINFSNMNYVQYEAGGKEYTLADVLKVAVVKGGFNGGRAEAQNLPYNDSLESFVLNGVLEGETTSETFGIVIFWAPNDNATDNLFNMNNGKTTSDSLPLHIDLGINLVATQEMYEEDSFGEDYDKNVTGPAVIKVDNADDLIAALSNITEPTEIDATGVAVDISTGDHFVIPGDVTIKGMTVNAKFRGGNYVVYAGDNIVLENCSFGNSDRSIVLAGTQNCSNVTYNNCTFSGQVLSNFVDNAAGVATFNYCTFTKGPTAFYSFAEAMGGTHYFNNCTFDYTGLTQSSMGVLNNACFNVYSEKEYSTTAVLTNCTRTNCGTRQYGPNSTLTIQ